MDEALKKLFAEMAASVKSLNETITAKFSTVDNQKTEAEKNKLVESIQELQKQIDFLKGQKAIRKMAWFVEGKTLGEGVRGVGFTEFMKALGSNDKALMSELGLMKTANGQSEGTNADGGYTVPIEFASEIVKLERQNSVARRICRIFPMGSLTRYVPTQLTNPTVTWTNEATNHTKTKATVDRLTQTAKKLSALIPVTEELLADNNVNLDAFLFQVVAEAMGREEDRVAFAGNADPFDGVLYETGVNSVSMDGASLAWTDLVSVLMALYAPYRANGRWVIGSSALSLIMKLKDDENRPIWTAPTQAAPGLILGKPYDETDQLTLTVEFGDFGRQLWLSDRGSYEVKASDSASDASGGAGSAFLQDEIWYKFIRRENILVAQPEAFAKMTVA